MTPHVGRRGSVRPFSSCRQCQDLAGRRAEYPRFEQRPSLSVTIAIADRACIQASTDDQCHRGQCIARRILVLAIQWLLGIHEVGSDAAIKLMRSADRSQRRAKVQPVLAVPTQWSGEVEFGVIEGFADGKAVGYTTDRPEQGAK